MKLSIFILFLFSIFYLNFPALGESERESNDSPTSKFVYIFAGNDVNKNFYDFQHYLIKNHLKSYSEYLRDQAFTHASRVDEILVKSDYWLTPQSSTMTVDAEIRQIQTDFMLTGTERFLLFEFFLKKLSQNLNSKDNKYYTEQLCWVYSNDVQIKNNFPKYEDFCNNKKIALSSLQKKLPSFEKLILDGNEFSLSDTKEIFYNNTPQKILLTSNTVKSVVLFEKVSSLSSLNDKDAIKLVSGNCESFKTSDEKFPESTKIYFNKSCIKNREEESFWSKSYLFLKNNKYELITTVILVALTANYLDSHTIELGKSSSLNFNISLP